MEREGGKERRKGRGERGNRGGKEIGISGRGGGGRVKEREKRERK